MGRLLDLESLNECLHSRWWSVTPVLTGWAVALLRGQLSLRLLIRLCGASAAIFLMDLLLTGLLSCGSCGHEWVTNLSSAGSLVNRAYLMWLVCRGNPDSAVGGSRGTM